MFITKEKLKSIQYVSFQNLKLFKFQTIHRRMIPLRKGMRSNVFDNMFNMMEKYANNLETLVDERTHLLHEEKRKTDDLLYLMLPIPVAEQLKHVRYRYFVNSKYM